MKKKIILLVMGLTLMVSSSAQTMPIDYNQLATNCQLVVEKNNQKNQKQQELSDLTAELENYKQNWWDICYAAMEDQNTSKEDIQYLIDNTYSDIDNNQLLADLNKALQGDRVTRQTMPQQPTPDKSKKDDKSKSQPTPQTETPEKEDANKDIKGDTIDNPQPEQSEPEKMDPTKKVNEPDKTVIPEKKEDKTKLKGDEVMKNYKKKNNNNKN